MLVHLGSRPPSYLRVAAEQVRFVTGREPIVISSRRNAGYESPKLKAFREGEQLSQFGLGGFWRYACERFFVLEEHMRSTELTSCIHIESDNLLYAPPADYQPWLRERYGEGLAISPLTESEDTAALMYVGSLAGLARFTDAMLELVAMPATKFLETYGGEMAHEMRMLNVLRTRFGVCDALPTTVEAAVQLDSAFVFDPGSYGQFVDGTYWEPGTSHADEQHEAGRALADGRQRLFWTARRDAPLVYAAPASGGEPIFLPLANLHVHSKRLDRWATPRDAAPPKPAGFPGEAGLRPRLNRAAGRALAAASRVRRGKTA